MKAKLTKVNKAIQKIIREDLRVEAKELVQLAPEDVLDELLDLVKDNNRNIFCMTLDFLKHTLVKEGTIRDTEFPSFGNPFGEL